MLDDAIFELLGVKDPQERNRLCEELYFETATHFRNIRIVEIQKQEQRSKSETTMFRIDELANDLWDSLSEDEQESILEFIDHEVKDGIVVKIPNGIPYLPDFSDMFSANTVFFRKSKGKGSASEQLILKSRGQAEIIYILSCRDVRGAVTLPSSAKEAKSLLDKLKERINSLETRINQLARSRTSDAKKVSELNDLLMTWLIHGKLSQHKHRTEMA